MIILLSLSINTAIPITIDQTPEYDLREGSLGYVYPLLDGFYAVEDWEVAVCLNKKYKEQLEQEETRNAINDMMANDYGGMVLTVTAQVEMDVIDEKDPTKTTNRHTVCYGIMPTGEDSLGFTISDKPNQLKPLAKGDAPAGVGAGGCIVKNSDEVICKIYMKIDGISSKLVYPVMDEEGNEVQC
jgi:hypothetical protein